MFLIGRVNIQISRKEKEENRKKAMEKGENNQGTSGENICLVKKFLY